MAKLTDEQAKRMRRVIDELRIQHSAVHDMWQELREEGLPSIEVLDVQIAISEAMSAAREALYGP